MRKLLPKPAQDAHDNLTRIQLAITHLRQARDLLKYAGAVRTVDRVRLALTSAGGAERHAERFLPR